MHLRIYKWSRYSIKLKICKISDFGSYQESQTQQILADRLLSESENFRAQVAEATLSNKKSVDYRLEEQTRDIEFYKNELLLTRKAVLLELEALSTMKMRSSNAFSSMHKKALAITEKCLKLRQRICLEILIKLSKIKLNLTLKNYVKQLPQVLINWMLKFWLEKHLFHLAYKFPELIISLLIFIFNSQLSP